MRLLPLTLGSSLSERTETLLLLSEFSSSESCGECSSRRSRSLPTARARATLRRSRRLRASGLAILGFDSRGRVQIKEDVTSVGDNVIDRRVDLSAFLPLQRVPEHTQAS